MTSRNASDSSASITHSERTPFGTWLTLGLICGIGLFNYIDRTVLAAVIPLIKVEFDLTDTSIGMLSGAFALLYAICGVPLGRLADNYSRRSIIGAAAAFWSAMTAACGLATGYWTLFFSRIGVAFGEAAFLPSAYSVISDLFSPARRHLAFGILSVFCSLGVVAGLAIGGGLAVAFGWRIAFILLGLPGLVFAALVFFLTKEPVRGGNDGGDSSEHEKHSLLSAIKALSRERVFMWIVSTSGFNGFCMLGMVQWLPSFFQRTHQLSIETIGLLFWRSLWRGNGIRAIYRRSSSNPVGGKRDIRAAAHMYSHKLFNNSRFPRAALDFTCVHSRHHDLRDHIYWCLRAPCAIGWRTEFRQPTPARHGGRLSLACRCLNRHGYRAGVCWRSQ